MEGGGAASRSILTSSLRVEGEDKLPLASSRSSETWALDPPLTVLTLCSSKSVLRSIVHDSAAAVEETSHESGDEGAERGRRVTRVKIGDGPSSV